MLVAESVGVESVDVSGVKIVCLTQPLTVL